MKTISTNIPKSNVLTSVRKTSAYMVYASDRGAAVTTEQNEALDEAYEYAVSVVNSALRHYGKATTSGDVTVNVPDNCPLSTDQLQPAVASVLNAATLCGWLDICGVDNSSFMEQQKVALVGLSNLLDLRVRPTLTESKTQEYNNIKEVQ